MNKAPEVDPIVKTNLRRIHRFESATIRSWNLPRKASLLPAKNLPAEPGQAENSAGRPASPSDRQAEFASKDQKITKPNGPIPIQIVPRFIPRIPLT